MADIFKFGGFLKNTLKRREKEAESETPTPSKDSTESQPSGMSQSDFLYGSEGMRRKEKKQ